MLKYKFYILLGLIFLFNSCDNGDIDLGNGYYLWNDKSFTCIIYTDTKRDHLTGLEVIPYEVVKTEIYNNFLLAINLDSDDKKHYWIIDMDKAPDLSGCLYKDCGDLYKANVMGPFDSPSFYQEIQYKNIKVGEDFENYKKF